MVHGGGPGPIGMRMKGGRQAGREGYRRHLRLKILGSRASERARDRCLPTHYPTPARGYFADRIDLLGSITAAAGAAPPPAPAPTLSCFCRISEEAGEEEGEEEEEEDRRRRRLFMSARSLARSLSPMPTP